MLPEQTSAGRASGGTGGWKPTYVGRTPGAEAGSVVDENRPFLIILQSENDQATGQFFPIGTGLFNIVNFRAHWDKVPVPGSNGQKIS
jgi:hypothetical protein